MRDGELMRVTRSAWSGGVGWKRDALPEPWERHLVPGSYEVTFALEDGRSATTKFVVTDEPVRTR